MVERTPQALIFDMDGTLFRTESNIVPAFERAYARLAGEGLTRDAMPSADVLLGSLGMLLKDIWSRVLPNSDERTRLRMDELLLEEQLALLGAGAGELYPGVDETLRKLQEEGYRLFVASNGLEPYVKGVAKALGIADRFEGLYSAGEFRTASKVDLVRLLLDRHEVASAWMVGDRSSDVEAGSKNGLPVVGCEYAAFGVPQDELRGAEMRIRAFPELLDLLGIAETTK
ncbi:HAD family hydrolase [Paenibacillus sp.]|uniref:HAD family hydrolase n=1 Tax=Paenibacillus sp. TaxID=58172 RepID=UPI002D276779|nr:HAD family hydrolase [Paenibacillus sp.]HZG83600.1 HAD family hydrolase [Paenibacillus sp.]